MNAGHPARQRSQKTSTISITPTIYNKDQEIVRVMAMLAPLRSRYHTGKRNTYAREHSPKSQTRPVTSSTRTLSSPRLMTLSASTLLSIWPGTSRQDATSPHSPSPSPSRTSSSSSSGSLEVSGVTSTETG
ncbi:hypothetical protein NP493_2g16007 [Ridgeia piscesae]|uniref:Uncharacterized protein n=1 Tax=Ridgeia piscesae TaxID=27915 RepID=A0AAD9PGK7_RIDPI|nr:hypothetical protein NP493_2g16007 [Ridgeia piscesae]